VNLESRYINQYVGFSNSYRCLGNLTEARKIQEIQIALIENNSTKNLAINQKEIYFFINSDKFLDTCNEKEYYFYHNILDTYDMQKCYYYYNIALTYYLLGNETKTLEYLKKADDLHLGSNSKSNVIKILNYDIEALQKSQPKFMSKTNEFGTLYHFHDYNVECSTSQMWASN